MRLIIDHQTRYHYADVVRRSTQYLRLTPTARPASRSSPGSWSCRDATCTTDGYGNILHVLSLESPTRGSSSAPVARWRSRRRQEDEEHSLISP